MWTKTARASTIAMDGPSNQNPPLFSLLVDDDRHGSFSTSLPNQYHQQPQPETEQSTNRPDEDEMDWTDEFGDRISELEKRSYKGPQGLDTLHQMVFEAVRRFKGKAISMDIPGLFHEECISYLKSHEALDIVARFLEHTPRFYSQCLLFMSLKYYGYSQLLPLDIIWAPEIAAVGQYPRIHYYPDAGSLDGWEIKVDGGGGGGEIRRKYPKGIYEIQNVNHVTGEKQIYIGSGLREEGGMFIRALQHSDHEYRERDRQKSTRPVYEDLGKEGWTHSIYMLSGYSLTDPNDFNYGEAYVFESLWQAVRCAGSRSKNRYMYREMQEFEKAVHNVTELKAYVGHRGLCLKTGMQT